MAATNRPDDSREDYPGGESNPGNRAGQAGDPTGSRQPDEPGSYQAEILGNGAIAQGSGAIAVAGDVHGPIHTGSGNIIQNITQYVTNPPPLQEMYRDLSGLISRHRGLLLAWLLLQTVLTVLYWQTSERYLIPLWAFLGLSILLAVVTVLWYQVVTRWSRQRLGMAIAATTAWSGLVILLIWAALYARQFPLERFGIAIATFYEGASLHATPRSRQVTQVLHDSLDNTIRNSDLFRDQVAVERIGVASREQATVDGKRLRAKLVIWGNVLTEEDGVFLNLEALETPSIVEDPDLPQTLPVASRATSLRVKVASGGTLDAEEIGRRLSSLVTSFSLGLFHYANYQYVDASRQFEAAAAEMADLSKLLPAESQEEVNPGLLYYYLGKTYQILGDFEKSREALDLAAQHNPTDPAIPVDQAYNYRVMEQPEAMEAALREAIRLTKEHYPEEPAAIHSSALAYERLGEYNRALEEYKAIIELDPDFFVAYLGAARVYMHPEGPLDFEAAWELYQRAIPVAEGDIAKQVWLNLDLGAWYQRNDQVDEAIAAYQRAIELNPQVSRPYYYLAQLYRKLGILDGAHLNFRRVLETAENPHWAHETYGQFLLDIGDHAGAVEQFNKALRYRIYSSALTYTNLARAYAGLGDLEAAVEAFEQALQDPGPDESYIRQWYAYVLQQSDRPLEAVHQLEAALDAGTTVDGRLMCQLAVLYRDTDNLEGARSLYQQALAAQAELSADDLRCVEEAHRDLLDTGPPG